MIIHATSHVFLIRPTTAGLIERNTRLQERVSSLEGSSEAMTAALQSYRGIEADLERANSDILYVSRASSSIIIENHHTHHINCIPAH